jgi:hypothetical protein
MSKYDDKFSLKISVNFSEKTHEDFLIPPVTSLIVVNKCGEMFKSSFVR